ncbi:3-isopropylmalate dehydratase large subunit [Candidatus Termititenax dinenymphae]|uniref:3-isopropylmalate dehydratase large subunit n=1 Tax=Candidatus Termititenax dinenymphae TaxID=2218523 RepID=A0A388TJU9_9BACT|nr:3-isopropylmalate dehydratase large subunit [Candidatus Termititenax dinenymphae]
MGMTITEKILAKAAGKAQVVPGEVVFAKVDIALAHDVTSDLAIDIVEQDFGGKVWDPDKIIVLPDHGVPNKDIQVATLVKKLLDFAEKKKIKNVYSIETGDYGVCHTMLPYRGFVRPGQVIVGADSHTCQHGSLGAFSTGIGSTELGNVFATGKLWFRIPESIKIEVNGKLPEGVMAKDVVLRVIGDLGVDGALYMAMEWTGSTIENMSIDERMTLTNMAIECGAKSGIIAPDKKTIDFVQARTKEKFEPIYSDADAKYAKTLTYKAEDLVPVVAKPFLPSNVVPAKECNDIKLNQAYLGSCTGGKYEDFVAAAKVLKGQKKAPHVRLLIVPATAEIQKQIIKDGLYDIFMQAGGVLVSAGCNACLGYHGGVLAAGEVAISTTNRNFRGRMGHVDSKVYLASPITAAKSAIAGYITDKI